MTKYEVPDDAWEDDEPEGPPAWKEDTSADIKFDVTLIKQGYQNNRKWTIHCSDSLEGEITAAYAVEHHNKGNYWREGNMHRDSVDFVDLPRRVRQRAAHVLNRDLEEITPEHRCINREDGTGFGDDYAEDSEGSVKGGEP